MQAFLRMKVLTIFNILHCFGPFSITTKHEIIIMSATANENIENESIASCGQPNQHVKIPKKE